MSVTLEIFPTKNDSILIQYLKSEPIISSIFPQLATNEIALKSLKTDTSINDSQILENSIVLSPVSTSLHIYKQKKDENFTTEDFIDGLTIHLSQEELDSFVQSFSNIDYTYSLVSKPTRNPLELKMLVAMTISLARLCEGYITIAESFPEKVPNQLYSPDDFYQEMKNIKII